MFQPCFFLLAIILLISCQLGGCAVTSKSSQWGKNAISLPSLHKMRRAAVDAATRPDTWGPAAAAVALHASGRDEQLSRWASSTTPVYGSQEAAKTASDTLRNASELSFYGTVLLVPSGNSFAESTLNKAKGVAIEATALNVANETTNFLKLAVGRERPFGNNFKSFPSGHTSSAVSHTTLGRRNLENLHMNPLARNSLNLGLTGLGIGTAWARVEAKAHYPTDVLAGAALANFITHFAYNAFLGAKERNVTVSVEPAPRGGNVQVIIPF